MAASPAAESAPVVAGAIRPRRTAPLKAWLRAYRSEVLTAAAYFGGWVALTAAVAHLTASVAWLVSIGLLLLSLGGWRLLVTLIVHGLYSLTREGRRG